jgi:hypothetical protein
MSAYIPLVCAIFGILLAMILVVTFPVSCCSSQKDGFQDTNIAKVRCPRGTKTYTTLSGDTMCCSGNVEGNKCDGKVLCTLSGNSSDKVPTCAKLRQDYLAKLQRQCPPSAGFTSYEDEDSGNKGCAAQTTADRNQPQTPATSFCRLYDDKNDNEYYPESCKNIEKNMKYNTVFMNSARPNFCMDVDQGELWKTKTYNLVGMAPCNGSDSQAFYVDEKNRVRNKKGGIFVFGNSIINVIDPEIVNLILNKPSTPPEDLVGENKVIVYDLSSSMTKVPTPNGGFSIGLGNFGDFYYGLGDTTKNGPIDNNTNITNISINILNKKQYDITKGAGEWSTSPLSSIKKPMANSAPKGYYWKCNLNKY